MQSPGIRFLSDEWKHLTHVTGRSSELGSYAAEAIRHPVSSQFGGRLLVVLNTRGGSGNPALETRGQGFEAEFLLVCKQS